MRAPALPLIEAARRRLCLSGNYDFVLVFHNTTVTSVTSLGIFRAGKGRRRANLHKWGLAQSPSCDCGQRQTMNHIADTRAVNGI